MTLEEILQRFKSGFDVLKVDCDYDLISVQNERILNKFENVLLEYHNLSDPLIEVLRNAGFTIIRSTVGKAGYPQG